jgi:phenylpropionate dioxygenase-like ring-hydroxylating dioxygenase large terminal subunit
LGATRMNRRLVFWRDRKGAVQCVADACVHRGVALSTGKVVGDNIQCPFHGLEFAGSGACTLIPANGKASPIPDRYAAPSFPVRDEHGFIWLWWGEPRDAYPPIPFFDDIDESFSSSTLRSPWATHYSRAIENQLDVAHVPFVHASTIGRGGRTLVNGPACKLEGDSLVIWPDNRKDEGQRPLRPEEARIEISRTHLQFIFPNIWENWISDNLRVFAAFAPVDEGNTVMYIRQYQRMARLPLLRQAFDATGKVFNRIIANQDKPVVETQLPRRTSLEMGEFLINADRPILLYRQRRRELGATTSKGS